MAPKQFSFLFVEILVNSGDQAGEREARVENKVKAGWSYRG